MTPVRQQRKSSDTSRRAARAVVRRGSVAQEEALLASVSESPDNNVLHLGGAISGRDIEAVNKTVSGLTRRAVSGLLEPGRAFISQK
jgi:hypothetical protein